MSSSGSWSLVDQLMEDFAAPPWARIQLHASEPPRDPAWTGATPVYVDSLWTQERGGVLLEPGTMYELVIDELMRPGAAEIRSGGRLLGTIPVSDPGDILGRIDAALEDWERDAMRWTPEG